MDYYADVWLNGQYLGFHEGMFNPFEFEITDLVDWQGENVLVVKDGAPRPDTDYIQADFSASPLSPPYKKHQARAINLIKGHMIDAMHKPGAMTSFRGDGNTGGIWGDVELIARPEVYVDYVKIYSKIGIKKTGWATSWTNRTERPWSRRTSPCGTRRGKRSGPT